MSYLWLGFEPAPPQIQESQEAHSIDCCIVPTFSQPRSARSASPKNDVVYKCKKLTTRSLIT